MLNMKMLIVIALFSTFVSCEKPEDLQPTEVQGSTDIVVTMEKASSVIIDIENRFNLIVRHLDFGIVEQGEQEFHWDGLDDNGQKLLPGIYFIRVGIDGDKYTYTHQTYRQDVW